MEIIKKTDGLTSADLYALTKGNDVRKMADAKGEVLDILSYVIYKDDKGDGSDPVTVLSIKTVDGVMYATNSKTFIREFLDMLSCFEEVGEKVDCIEILTGTSKAGREYISCRYAGE